MCRSSTRTFNGLALREVIVLSLGEETSFVPSDDPLQESA